MSRPGEALLSLWPGRGDPPSPRALVAAPRRHWGCHKAGGTPLSPGVWGTGRSSCHWVCDSSGGPSCHQVTGLSEVPVVPGCVTRLGGALLSPKSSCHRVCDTVGGTFLSLGDQPREVLLSQGPGRAGGDPPVTSLVIHPETHLEPPIIPPWLFFPLIPPWLFLPLIPR